MLGSRSDRLKVGLRGVIVIPGVETPGYHLAAATRPSGGRARTDLRARPFLFKRHQRVVPRTADRASFAALQSGGGSALHPTPRGPFRPTDTRATDAVQPEPELRSAGRQLGWRPIQKW